MSTKKIASAKDETMLAAERAELLARVAAIDLELAREDEHHARILADDGPSSPKLDQVEEIRERLVRERARLTGRIDAINGRLIPEARREAARLAMLAREKEYVRLADELAKSLAPLRTIGEELRRVEEALPDWGGSILHPEFRMRQLAEEIRFDASEAGVDAPELPDVPRLSAEEAAALHLARRILRRAGFLDAGLGQPLTARGKAEQKRLRERQGADSAPRQAAPAA